MLMKTCASKMCVGHLWEDVSMMNKEFVGAHKMLNKHVDLVWTNTVLFLKKCEMSMSMSTVNV